MVLRGIAPPGAAGGAAPRAGARRRLVEQIAILRRMAEKWLEAADEVAHPALKRCYLERAASYERLALRQDRGYRGPHPDPADA